MTLELMDLFLALLIVYILSHTEAQGAQSLKNKRMKIVFL